MMCDEESALLNNTKTMSPEHEQKCSIIPGNKTCRACLIQNKDMRFLFPDQQCYDNTNPQNELLEMFTSLTALIANPDDPYPKHICDECLNKLHEAYNFWKMCRKSIEILNKLNDGMIEIDIKQEYDYACNECDREDDNYTDDQKNEEDKSDCNNSLEDGLINDNEDFLNYSESLHSTTTDTPNNNIQQESCMLNSNIDECHLNTYESNLHSTLDTNTKNNMQLNSSVKLRKKKIHCCQKCNLSFQNKQEYTLHNHEYHEIMPYNCNKCRLSFLMKKEYSRHWRQNHRACKLKAKQESGMLNSNVDECVSELNMEIYHCRKCNLSFKNKHEYLKHRHENHVSIRKSYNCNKCKLSFPTKHKYDRHRKQNHPITKSEIKYHCLQCQQHDFTETEHRSHRQVVHSLGTYYCRRCPLYFDSDSERRKHSYTHTKYLCSECGYTTYSDERLQRHIYTHSDLKRFECTICGKKYKHISALNVHKRVHSDDRLKYPCQYCDRVFLIWRSRDYHIRRHHNSSNNRKCNICSKAFITNTALTEHIRRDHTGERPVSCEICSMKFVSKANLRNHMFSHSDVRKYICKVCEKGFKLQKHLTQHMVTHFAERRHKCEICQKSYTQAYVLKCHMKKHEKDLIDA